MTQVITVSATTAAYVSEAYKQVTKPSGAYNPLEEAITEWHDKTLSEGDPSDKAIMSLVKPPALALTFLTAKHSHMPQLTAEQANEEYKATS